MSYNHQGGYMRKNISIYLIIGFLTGITYTACGGAGGIANTIAETLGAASDVSYSNTSSNLTSTSVQEALDELANLVNNDSNSENTALFDEDLEEALVGVWNGSVVSDNGNSDAEDLALTLNEDGTYSCSGSNGYFLTSTNSTCTSPVSWEIIGSTLIVTYDTNTKTLFDLTRSSGSKITLKRDNDAILQYEKN